MDGIHNSTCTCADGFTGQTCETNIDNCDDDPCQNTGTCVDGINSYMCSCTCGFGGRNCEMKINNGNDNYYQVDFMD